MDWATRKVLSWRLSNTMHAEFCVEALNEAIDKLGPPETMNAPSRDILRYALSGSGSGIAVRRNGLDHHAERSRGVGLHG